MYPLFVRVSAALHRPYEAPASQPIHGQPKYVLQIDHVRRLQLNGGTYKVCLTSRSMLGE